MSDAPGHDADPYAPPAADLEAPAPSHDEEVARAERYRRSLLGHETSVKALGCLYYLGAGFSLLSALGAAAVLGSGVENPEMARQPIVAAVGLAGAGLFYLALGGLQITTGYGLRRLRPWARILAAIFSAVGLLAIPIGTIICGYLLYLLLGSKGAAVFTEDYREVVAKTPHVKYRTSTGVKVFGAIVLLGIVALIVMAAMG